ncbi:LuxR C-terminal-related transcriptional regulator [Arenibaculum sp.]|uniref:LuxR C-terminal-related transcriptional regulator n=1 Tax=Arenibaculum sp. TaxID=2865862 RepID=UPI002E10AD49|nr:LuxR C-terminal-related transcriptional regulator [Arenibaculum sp.]
MSRHGNADCRGTSLQNRPITAGSDANDRTTVHLEGEVAAMEKKLTNREIEVLKWSSYGKTAQEVSEIMIISVNTVNFHVKNAMMKLDTPNKTATVARASILGLLG